MKDLYMNLLKLFLVRAITFFLVASCNKPSYSNGVHPHGELALVSYILRGAHSAPCGFCVCDISMRSHVMAKLEGDTFECAGNLVDLLTNPFQLCHPHLVVNGKAPNLVIGAHSHA